MQEIINRVIKSKDELYKIDQERRMNQAKSLLWSFKSGCNQKRKEKIQYEVELPSMNWWGRNQFDNKVYYYHQGIQYDIYREVQETVDYNGSVSIQRKYIPYSKAYRLVFYPGSICYRDTLKPVGKEFVYGDKFRFVKPKWEDIVKEGSAGFYYEHDETTGILNHKRYEDFPKVNESIKKDGQPLDYFLIKNERTKKVLKVEPTFWFVKDTSFKKWEYYMIERKR